MYKKILLLVVVLFCHQAMASGLNQSFESKEYRYSIMYPDDWKCADKGKGTLLCKTGNGVTINLQTLYTQKGGGKYASVKSLMDDFYGQVPLHTIDAKFLSRSPYTFVDLNGEQTYVTFKEGKISYKQWQIMLTTDDGLLFQAFAYRAPEKVFDQYLPVAKEVLRTWNIYK